MKHNDINDFDFIKDKFEKSYPATPESLSEDSINQLLLSKQEPKVIKLKPRYNVKAIVSAAAGLLLFLGIMYAAYTSGLFSGNSGKVGNFESYNEVNVSSTFSDSDESKSSYEDYSELDSILDRMGWDPIDGNGAGDFAVQLVDKNDNVQEPDQIKGDGEYVYHLYTNSLYDENGREERQNRIYIFKVNDGESELVSIINYEANGGEGHSGSFYARMNDLYVYNDRLIVELWVDDSDLASEYRRDCHKTITQIYDISDRSSPKLISEFEQSGEKISSQMIDNYLYTVSYYYAPEEKGKYTIPSSGNLNKAVSIPVQNISVFDNSYVSHYVVVSAIDVESGEKISDSKAVLGASEFVFFNGNNLYIIDYSYNLDIFKAELNEGAIEISERATVNGDFDYSVQLVESNGLLFVYGGSNILIVNEEFEVLGEIAVMNGINASRFVGNMLYIVTYSDGYELRAIDISEPQKPTVLGVAKLDNDVREIIPVNDDYLLCFGETEDYFSGIITLVDVSDKSDPETLDTKEFNDDLHIDIFSDFVINSEKGYLAIPCSDYSAEESKRGVITVEIVNGKIEITNSFINENIDYDGRWVNIGDYLYCYSLDSEAPMDKTFTVFSYKYE